MTDVVDDPKDCEEQDDDTRDEDADCPIDLCGISAYYRRLDQLPEWVKELLPPLE